MIWATIGATPLAQGGSIADLRCTIGDNGTAIAPAAWIAEPYFSVRFDTNNVEGNFPLSGLAQLPAGSHNLQVSCYALVGPTIDIATITASIVAIAV